jgi:hypothetical protein
MRSPAFALRTLIGVAVDVLFLSRRRKYTNSGGHGLEPGSK